MRIDSVNKTLKHKNKTQKQNSETEMEAYQYSYLVVPLQNKNLKKAENKG
jgi:hypothetical protein